MLLIVIECNGISSFYPTFLLLKNRPHHIVHYSYQFHWWPTKIAFIQATCEFFSAIHVSFVVFVMLFGVINWNVTETQRTIYYPKAVGAIWNQNHITSINFGYDNILQLSTAVMHRMHFFSFLYNKWSWFVEWARGLFRDFTVDIECFGRWWHPHSYIRTHSINVINVIEIDVFL